MAELHEGRAKDDPLDASPGSVNVVEADGANGGEGVSRRHGAAMVRGSLHP